MSSKAEKGSGTRARPRLTVLAGPSGVGKSSVLEELRTLGTEVYYSVSVTTRKPRPGEVDGEHYHFVDRVEYDRMVDEGELLEHAEYAGNCYGTPRRPVEAALERGTPAILEIEVQGARQVRRAMPEALLVLLKPPTWEVLVARLTGRGTEDPAVVAHRLKVAEEELAAEAEFDVVLVNSDVRTVARDLLTLVVGSPTERVPSEP